MFLLIDLDISMIDKRSKSKNIELKIRMQNVEQ